MGDREADDADEWCDHEVVQEVGAGHPERDPRDLVEREVLEQPDGAEGNDRVADDESGERGRGWDGSSSHDQPGDPFRLEHAGTIRPDEADGKPVVDVQRLTVDSEREQRVGVVGLGDVELGRLVRRAGVAANAR